MTITLSIKVNDGLIMAADSATTMYQGDALVNIYDNANKVFVTASGKWDTPPAHSNMYMEESEATNRRYVDMLDEYDPELKMNLGTDWERNVEIH